MTLNPRILVAISAELRAWNVAPPEQPYWRMYWNDAEGAAVVTRKGRWELGPDQLLLIAPHTWFQGRLTRPLHHTYVHALLGPPLDGADGLVMTVPLDAGRRRLAAALGDLPPLQRELSALSLFTWAAATLPDHAWPTPPADARIARAQQRLSEDLARPIAIADLAAELGLHPNGFTRLFRRHCGCPPLAWGLRRRLDEACQLLVHGDVPVADIARRCGFADHRHLGAAFRRRFGEAPSAFRRSHTHSVRPIAGR